MAKIVEILSILFGFCMFTVLLCAAYSFGWEGSLMLASTWMAPASIFFVFCTWVCVYDAHTTGQVADADLAFLAWCAGLNLTGCGIAGVVCYYPDASTWAHIAGFLPGLFYIWLAWVLGHLRQKNLKVSGTIANIAFWTPVVCFLFLVFGYWAVGILLFYSFSVHPRGW